MRPEAARPIGPRFLTRRLTRRSRTSSRICRLGGLLAILAVLAAAGCGHDVGDSCTYNTDCDPMGTRVCDVSQPGGYCTVEGCDTVRNKCPGGSACIRFFPTLDMTKPCAPEHEDVCGDRTPGCDPDQDPNCCRCTADEECITEGFCIRRELEYRECMKTCGGDSDCRGGYACYASGAGGAELIPNDDGTLPPVAHFCAAQP